MVNALITSTVSIHHHRKRSANVPQVVRLSRGPDLPHWMTAIRDPKTAFQVPAGLLAGATLATDLRRLPP